MSKAMSLVEPKIDAAKKGKEDESLVWKFKRRILEWPNPVEYVNNMYGTHPDDKKVDYFKKIYGE